MKKKIIFSIVVGLLLISFSAVYAGGGPRGTYVHFLQGSTYDCHTYWLMTGSGLVHEWRNNSSCAAYSGHVGLHLVFKPYPRFPAADCDDDGFLGSAFWTANLGYYTDYTDDDADLDDFITNGAQYWVCFYSWNHAELP